MNYSELLQLAKGWGNFKFYRIIIWRLPQINIETIATTYPEQSEDNQILEALLALQPKYKEVLLLHYVEGYKCQEISGILKIKEATVKKRLERGRNILKKELRGEVSSEKKSN